MLSISSFFLSNHKILNQVDINVDLQSNGERIINKISEVAMASSEIIFVDGQIADENTQILDDRNIKSIVFKTLLKSDVQETDDFNEYFCIITYDDETEKLFYDKLEIASIGVEVVSNEENLKNELNSKIVEMKAENNYLGKYVKEIKIKEIKDGENITRGINIKLLLSKPVNNNDNNKVLENRVMFRN